LSKIAVINTNNEINSQIQSACEDLGSEFQPYFLSDNKECMEFLKYELPEIAVYNFLDENIDTEHIIRKVTEDPWLHYCGIIGIHKHKQENEFKELLKKVNIVSMIPETKAASLIPRILKIIKENRQILFQRYMQSQILSSISGSFIIENDPFDIDTYSNILPNYLFNTNFINQDKKEQLQIALTEILMNAVEHGNCDISYEEKTEWLESGNTVIDLILEKNKDPEIRNKKVIFEYRITPEKTFFHIKDQGHGFNWEERLKKLENPENLLNLHGRGIMMSRGFVDKLTYNRIGNEVWFEISHQINESNVIPDLFNKKQEIVYRNGEVIIYEGEKANNLYYIVSGKLNILYNNKVISSLTPADIFLGEMSFLLDNTRSATVVSEGRSVLLKITKKEFLEAIKLNPYYCLLLARLLAQRLNKLNKLVK
jgi:anti-sigma regulatory factor (Ser/Thr protein kinase)